MQVEAERNLLKAPLPPPLSDPMRLVPKPRVTLQLGVLALLVERSPRVAPLLMAPDKRVTLDRALAILDRVLTLPIRLILLTLLTLPIRLTPLDLAVAPAILPPLYRAVLMEAPHPQPTACLSAELSLLALRANQVLVSLMRRVMTTARMEMTPLSNQAATKLPAKAPKMAKAVMTVKTKARPKAKDRAPLMATPSPQPVMAISVAPLHPCQRLRFPFLLLSTSLPPMPPSLVPLAPSQAPTTLSIPRL